MVGAEWLTTAMARPGSVALLPCASAERGKLGDLWVKDSLDTMLMEQIEQPFLMPKPRGFQDGPTRRETIHADEFGDLRVRLAYADELRDRGLGLRGARKFQNLRGHDLSTSCAA